jgi:membrane-associated phospholipid phosphatase
MSTKKTESDAAARPSGISRRNFVRGAAAATAVAAAIPLQPLLGSNDSLAHAQSDGDDHQALTGTARADESFELRVAAAKRERAVPIPDHPTNGDEQRFDNRIGNYSKGLPHNEFGEVDEAAYKTLLRAVNSGRPADFENITLGAGRKFVNPQSGLAFDLQGTDSHQLAIPPSPAVASAERAAEMVEVYWQALARDVPFSQFGHEPITTAAIADLNNMQDFKGPKINGKVTAQTLFRGLTPGDLVGPYVSQFFLMPAPFGSLAVLDAHGNPAQQYISAREGVDFMTDTSSFLNIQNGGSPTASLSFVGPRYIHASRVLNAFVHVDELYQAYFMATLNILDQMQVAFNPGNPYNTSRTQVGFGTFGNPAAVALVAEVSTRALKAVWYQKWFVHRALRPEAFGGLVHFKKTANRDYPLHPQVLNSTAVQAVFSKNGTFFLPMAFPEGSPTHPSYGSGHATVAGACATFIKAFFDENHPIEQPVIASDDGMSLVPYTGPGFDKMTIGTEANKIASNVGLARNSAGVHWRSDHQQSTLLGEAIAISILRDQRDLYNEDFGGFTFTKFDGTKITV